VSEAPDKLCIAGYSDAGVARQDWDALETLLRSHTITVRGLVLVDRDRDGWVDVKEHAHEAGKGAAMGAVAGAIVGVVFPPAVLVTSAVGAAIGAAFGSIFEQADKDAIRDGVDKVLPPGSTGIIVFVETRWIADVDKALARADSVTKHDIDRANSKEVEKALAGDS
jgi:uncharacterized membrane protein